MMRRLPWMAAVVLLGLVPAGPAGAQAELGCSPDPGIEARIAEAPTVFTGTVRVVENEGRTATVDVIRVWRGQDLPKRVEVRGTIATQSKVITALDRLYAVDRTYLFLPTAGASPRFVENRCSATRALDARLAALAPSEGGRAPVGEGVPLPSKGIGRLVPLMIVLPALVVLGGLLLAARRQTKRRHGSPAPVPGT
jgi:hypothetical protein